MFIDVFTFVKNRVFNVSLFSVVFLLLKSLNGQCENIGNLKQLLYAIMVWRILAFRQNCLKTCRAVQGSQGNVVSGSIRFMQIFAGVRWRGGVK